MFAVIAFDGVASAEDRACAIATVDGAEARAWHRGEWSPLVPGPVPDDTVVIATGSASRAEIVCDDGIVATIGADTSVSISALTGPSGGERDIVLDLLDGIIGLVAPERTWRRFDVRTPMAIASVRSTEWLVDVDDAQGTAVFVREGRVAVADDGGGEVVLARGEGVDVGAAGLGPVRVWGAARVDAAGARLGFGWR